MAVNLDRTTIWALADGGTMTAGTFGAGAAPDTYNTGGWSLSSSQTGIWTGKLTFPGGPFDCSGSQYISMLCWYALFGQWSGADTLANGGFRILLFDGSSNWVEYYVFGSDYTSSEFGNWPSNSGYNPNMGIFTIDRTRTPTNSSGTIDWTDIAGVELTVKGVSARTFRINIYSLQVVSPQICTGSVGFADIPTELQGVSDNNYKNYRHWASPSQNFRGLAGNVWCPFIGFKVGDGSTATTMSETGFDLGFYPNGTSTDTGCPMLYLDDNQTRWITFNQSASDSVAWASGTISGSKSTDYQWGLKVEGSASGACTLSTIRFLRSKEIRLAHATATNCTFDDCEDVQITASTAMTGAIFRNLSATSKGLHIEGAAGNYSSITATFENTNSGDDITVGSGGAGTYVLTGIATSGGHTINIHNDSATNAVTVEIPSGILYTTSTAGGTITISAPSTTYTIQLPNIIDGSRYQIYNVTQATELTNGVVSGGGGIDETYTLSTDYNALDVGRIRVTYVSGTTAKEEYSTTFTFASTTTTNSIPATQTNDEVYNDNAIDGSAITKFSADYVDTEVDVIVTSNWSGAELYAWYTYNNTTANGIANFFGVVRTIDAANFEIDQTVADVMFDITTTANVYQTDNIRIFRKDGAYPVKNPTTGGGAIDLVWREKVLIAETGVSGLTAAESTQLSAIDTLNTLLDELHKIHGLDASNPMTVTPTSRAAGSISQTISGDGETTSTVTRT